LLDLDPDLGAQLSRERFAMARSELRVRVVALARGEWAGGELASISAQRGRGRGPGRGGLRLVPSEADRAVDAAPPGPDQGQRAGQADQHEVVLPPAIGDGGSTKNPWACFKVAMARAMSTISARLAATVRRPVRIRSPPTNSVSPTSSANTCSGRDADGLEERGGAVDAFLVATARKRQPQHPSHHLRVLARQ
jgi:hypothetical protein